MPLLLLLALLSTSLFAAFPLITYVSLLHTFLHPLLLYPAQLDGFHNSSISKMCSNFPQSRQPLFHLP